MERIYGLKHKHRAKAGDLHGPALASKASFNRCSPEAQSSAQTCAASLFIPVHRRKTCVIGDLNAPCIPNSATRVMEQEFFVSGVTKKPSTLVSLLTYWLDTGMRLVVIAEQLMICPSFIGRPSANEFDTSNFEAIIAVSRADVFPEQPTLG
mmetsp:Transcript_4274/g.7162  ORF Transcript_4274/g.7162 Transcript_4274/m.7162 type:complete len:152 (-) Transcript_4274:596-1051(-)